MHVVLISQCEHRAIARTARVLDAYAHRQGDRTWMTPITREGLQTLHSMLRASATRQTAVACYVSQGMRQMRLLWVVGAKGRFGPMGVVAVASRRSAKSSMEDAPALPVGWRVAALLARLAGYLHDLGKFGTLFQDKLKGAGPMADAVRHEWLSLHILQELKRQNTLAPLDLLGTAWSQTWQKAATRNGLTRIKDLTQKGAPLAQGLRQHWGALLFLVFTHHRLPGEQSKGSNVLADVTYIAEHLTDQNLSKLHPVAQPSQQTVDLVRKTAERLDELAGQLGDDSALWRAVASLARMGLILADHSVSSVDKTQDSGHGRDLQNRLQSSSTKAAFANTVRQGQGPSQMNQELNWHLQNVGNAASEFVARFARFQPPGLSDEVMEGLRQPTSERFAWQGEAAAALREAQATECLPTLAFNVAGTGCGKTRMNVLAVAALRDTDTRDSTVRISTALNLRTLTLQTHDAYAEQLHMGKHDLACVIGSAVAQRLHEDTAQTAKAQAQSSLGSKKWGVDEDGNPEEESFDAIGEADPPPSWLEHFLQRKPRMRPVVMAPVLVCTIDHLIKAGEPTEQGNHALTNLRLMRSDLVLDEVDSYDPQALVAVMRLVTAAAFWGRHVVASSATLAAPVALALWNAYRLGARMRTQLNGLPHDGRFRVAMIDDKCPARLSAPTSTKEFGEWFSSALRVMLDSFGVARFRPCEVVPVELTAHRNKAQGQKAVLQAITGACGRMHQRHQWTVTVDGEPHSLSLGLVRIANINRAVAVAAYLSQQLPHARIACYHSNLPRIARFMLERSLDQILTRKDEASGPQSSTDIFEAVRRSRAAGQSETLFIVVATPVEEIGRDHDFDWAVIEPSSVQSIVQTAGRVNRHRLANVNEPNVAVLQFNFCQASNSEGKACFTRPGLETKATPYSTHDLQKLFDWEELARNGQIDARARFHSDKHAFAKHDDFSAQEQIKTLSASYLDCDRYLWISRDTYEEVPLRERSYKDVISQDENGVYHREHRDGPHETVWLKAEVRPSNRLSNDWLVWSFDEALAEARRVGLSALDAFAVELNDRNQEEPQVYCHSPSLGYYRE